MQATVRAFVTRQSLFIIFLVSLFVGLGGKSWGQVVITTSGTAVTQDFNSLASSGTSSTVPTGWAFLEVGGNTTYTAGTGSSSTGDTYSFGATSSTDRAFGTLLSGSVTSTIGASFKNSTGATITSIAISYTGEQWRLGATGRVDSLGFSYSTSATSLNAASYVEVTSGNFQAPITSGTVGALDGNATANKKAISFTITGLSIASNATFWIRWTDFNATGADDGLGIDDFSLTATTTGGTINSITTGTISGSPFCTTGSSASVSVPFSYSPTANFPNTTTFTAQLSTAGGGWTGAQTIGTVASDGTGTQTIAGTIPANTTTGTGYRIRVISNTPAVTGTDNGTSLTIQTFASNTTTIAPTTAQTIPQNQTGSTLTATTANTSTYTWKYGTTSGGPYGNTISGATSSTYQPAAADFGNVAGTYYLVSQATSTCGSIVGTSNEVVITVTVPLPVYYRTLTSGNWNSTSSWQTSNDQVTWAAATSVPTNAAAGIQIRNTHTVTMTADATAKLLVIDQGGILTSTTSTDQQASNYGGWQLTLISDGTSTPDMIINGRYDLFGKEVSVPTGATVVVNSGAEVRVISSNGSPSTSDDFAANARVFFNTGALFNWTATNSFSTGGVTYFPNAQATDVAVFRISANVASVGAGSATVFNSKFEVASTNTITFANAGSKTFRDGIGGAGTLIHSSNCGPFIVSSATAVIDGTVTVSLVNNTTSGVNELEIPAIASVTMSGSPVVKVGTSGTAATLLLSGAIINNSTKTIDLTNGTLIGSRTGVLTLNNATANSLSFSQTVSGGNYLKNLTIGALASATLTTPLNITEGTAYGTVICNGTFQTNGNLTLKSDINGTAAVGQSAGTITGNVTVERFTDGSLNQGNSRRAWRLMTSPITGQNIHDAWQETGVNNNSFGTLITGEGLTSTQAAAQGYDYLPDGANKTSIKHYVGGAWVPLSSDGNTNGTKIPVRTEPAYMVFVRGDRTVGVSGNSTANLRATGALLQGNQTFTIGTGAYTLISNPYASSINFGSIYTNSTTGGNSSIRDQFYLWNSKLGTYGAYVLVSHTGTGTNAGNYRAIPSSLAGFPTQENDAYKYIPSGSGFFVSRATSPTSTTLTIREADKAASSNPPVTPFRVVPNAANVRELLVNLNLKNDTSSVLADGFAADFSSDYEGNEEDNSSVKADNFYENLGLVRNGVNHIIEARGEVKKTDTLQLQMWNVSYRSYELQMKGDNFTTAPGIRAWLVDSYKGAKQEVSLSGSITTVSFDVNKDSGSWKSTRFMIVFENSGAVLPVTITKVSAQPKNGEAEVNWTVSNEVNIKGYTVEKSNNGSTFTVVGTQQSAKNNPQAALTSYSAYDAAPKLGDNYYRIRIEGKDGSISYSSVVKVTIGANGSGIQITLYPNPVREGKANLTLTNLKEGTYVVSVFSGSGQTLYQKKVTITLSNTSQTEQLLLGSHLAQGSYQIRVADSKGVVLYTDKLIVSK